MRILHRRVFGRGKHLQAGIGWTRREAAYRSRGSARDAPGTTGDFRATGSSPWGAGLGPRPSSRLGAGRQGESRAATLQWWLGTAVDVRFLAPHNLAAARAVCLLNPFVERLQLGLGRSRPQAPESEKSPGRVKP